MVMSFLIEIASLFYLSASEVVAAASNLERGKFNEPPLLLYQSIVIVKLSIKK